MKMICLALGASSLSGCFLSNVEEGPFYSSSKHYSVVAKVNRVDESRDDYADVLLYLLNENGRVIDSVNSGAGDFSSWTVGWTETGDTIVLYSGDIGSTAWSIDNDKMRQLDIKQDTLKYASLFRRAGFLDSLSDAKHKNK
jgi:hypothetical protein